MGYVIHIDGDTGGGGGSGTGWDGQVEFRADLPITLGSPAIGSIYLVEKKTTLLGFTTYQSGLYIRDTNSGSLSDWRRLNVKVEFTDSEFTIVSSADNSKKAKFDLSLVTTSTTRTYIYPDKNGTIALLSDITGGNETLAQTLTLGDETGNNNIFLVPGAGPVSSPQTRGAIVLKDPGSLYSVAAFYLENDVNTGIDVSGGGTNDGVIAVKGTLQASIRHQGTNNGFTAINTGCSISGFLTMQASDGFQLQDGANEIIFTANPTSNGLTQTFQDDSGVIALLKNLKASQGNFIKNILDAGTLTANVNDWSPVGFDADTDLIRVDINANNRQITGVEAPSVGVNRILGINNINAASFDLRFMHNNGSSLAENRFLLRDNGNRAIKPNETAWFWYDHSVQRWKPFNRIG